MKNVQQMRLTERWTRSVLWVRPGGGHQTAVFFLARDTDKSESGKQLKMARRKSHNLEVESEPVNKGKAADGAGCFFVRMPKSSSALAGATK